MLLGCRWTEYLELSMRLAEVEYCGSPRPNWKWMAIAINTGLSLSPLLYSIAFAHWLPVQ